MDPSIINEATAIVALTKARDDLARTADARHTARENLVGAVLRIRPAGLLTVNEMAEAVECDRNWIDDLWTSSGNGVRDRRSRFPVAPDADPVAARQAYDELSTLAAADRRAVSADELAVAARNRVVTMVYASKLMRIAAIADAVGLHRNHVMRLARKAGIPPHREGVRNQYTATTTTTA